MPRFSLCNWLVLICHRWKDDYRKAGVQDRKRMEILDRFSRDDNIFLFLMENWPVRIRSFCGYPVFEEKIFLDR